MELQGTYQNLKRAYARRGENFIQIDKEEKNGIPIYTTNYTNDESLLSDLKMSVAGDIGIDGLFYRGAKIESLERILETGHDIPEMDKGKSTWATKYLDKAAEYGGGSQFNGVHMQKDKLIIIYDNDSFDITNDDGGYEVIFNKSPKEALKGVVVFKSREAE